MENLNEYPPIQFSNTLEVICGSDRMKASYTGSVIALEECLGDNVHLVQYQPWKFAKNKRLAGFHGTIKLARWKEHEWTPCSDKDRRFFPVP